MKTHGIRISDTANNVLTVSLSDILEEISSSSLLQWSILFVDGTLKSKQGKSLNEYEAIINKSENGLRISLNELKLISDSFCQMYETIVLGCKDVNLLRRYKSEKEMYLACDVVIDLIDCVFWEVYSKDLDFIQKLKGKFKDTEMIAPIRESRS